MLGNVARFGALVGAALLMLGCAQGAVTFASGGEGGTATGSDGGAGGSGGGTGGSGGEPVELPCGIDCASVVTNPCHVAECNLATKQCEVKNAAAGTACDDGLFCTVEDSCVEGVCKGGPQNDCNMDAPVCTQITCDETTKKCSSTPMPNGAACTDPNDLCIVGGKCMNGLCVGQQNDCFFAPVPDDCHVPVCNPQNGKCEPQPGNDGQPCTDLDDLCTVGKKCDMGACTGGTPKDCSQLTKDCNLGVCDPNSGTCTTKAVADNDPCDDLNACTTGEICGGGKCAGGSPVTMCKNADGCCPMGCNEGNDDDCGCGINLALAATGFSSGGGANAYGPKALNDGVDEAGCKALSCSNCFNWISNSTTPGTAYVQYDWPGVQSIGSIYVDAKDCNTVCSNTGRTLFSGVVQYWDGAQWVNAQAFTNNDGDLKLNFVPKLQTSKLRIYQAAAGSCNQNNNTLIFEWYVWTGANCTP